ncbi:MAG: sigma-70 family RNA polymerase sigma factor [Acidobacteriota bacterium]
MTPKHPSDAPTNYTQFTDSQLVVACLENDALAWEALIHRYQRLIYSIPIKHGFSSVDAADVFQSVCLILLKNLAALRKQEKLYSWLMTTTTRECWRVAARWQRDAYEREGDEVTGRLEEAAIIEPLAEDEQLALERQHLVREAIARLSERCRQLITLLFYSQDEPAYAEISRRLHIPVASIGPTRARCLQKLKKDLQNIF